MKSAVTQHLLSFDVFLNVQALLEVEVLINFDFALITLLKEVLFLQELVDHGFFVFGPYVKRLANDVLNLLQDFELLRVNYVGFTLYFHLLLYVSRKIFLILIR